MKTLRDATLIVLLGAFVALVLQRALLPMRVAENWTRDFRVAELSPPREQNDQIVVVTVTEDTLAELPYRSPLDRAFLAQLLHDLDAAGARAIGVDILFDQPTERVKDRLLQDTLRNLRAPVRIAFADEDAGLTRAQSAFLERFTDGLGLGYANFVKDSADGVVRWIYPGKAGPDGFVPGLAVAIAQDVSAAVPSKGHREAALDYLSAPDALMPAFRIFPAHLVKSLSPAVFKDRIVFVGADLPLIDRHRTPFAATRGATGNMPGVVVHAHALAQLLDGRAMAQIGWGGEVALVVLLSMLGMVLARMDISPAAKGTGFVASTAAYGVAAALAWRWGGAMLPVLDPTVGLTISMGGAVVYFGWHDREQKRFIRRAFSRYLSPALVTQLLDNPSQLTVGGEKRELTYLFTDITGFTRLTEESEPERLVPLLNAYIDGMCKTAIAHGATLDKVVGDAIVCFFNAPIAQPDHPQRAVRCALALHAFAQNFAAEQHAQGIDFGLTRIGVHSGWATIGNFGGDAFFDYTAFGDMVNTASRLESANKHLGTSILVSEPTQRRCPEISFRPVGRLVLIGKRKGLMTFEPLDGTRVDAPATDAYKRAYALLKEGDPGARSAFAKALALDPNDALAAFHITRLEHGDDGDLVIMARK